MVERKVVEMAQKLDEHRQEWRAVNAEQQKNKHEEMIAAGQPLFPTLIMQMNR